MTTPPSSDVVLGDLFELELYGEGVERRYRKMRPEVERMPWGTLDPSKYPADAVLAARRSWTGAAFQEHRTGVACAMTLRALLEARAPLDLVALATRFPLDEIVHVELCARLAMELGGGTEIRHDPTHMVPEPPEDGSPIERAAHLVVKNFCVGEALSIPLLRGTWKAADHPLPRAVLGRIVKDEAAHGVFGWQFLDWAADRIDAPMRKRLAQSAGRSIAGLRITWDDIRKRRKAARSDGHALGWMETDAYLELAQTSLRSKVLEPLAKRGIDVAAVRPDAIP